MIISRIGYYYYANGISFPSLKQAVDYVSRKGRQPIIKVSY